MQTGREFAAGFFMGVIRLMHNVNSFLLPGFGLFGPVCIVGLVP